MSGGLEGDGDRWPGPIPYTVSPYLCLEFVNSRFADHTGSGEVHDRLEMPRWRQWFASRAGVQITPALPPDRRRELLVVRARLRGLLESRAVPDADTADWINRYLAAAPAVWTLRRTESGVRMEPTWRADWAGLIAAVFDSYGRLVEDRRIDRVRCCANVHCTWLFYDESRNGSRRWCDPHRCGNLVGVRAHRARARASPDPGPARGELPGTD